MSISDSANLDTWITRAQANSDLSDALYAQSASLCIYLLDMREFFRWNRGLALSDTLQRSELGPWIAECEAAWDSLRGRFERGVLDYQTLDGKQGKSPFDLAGIQPLLDQHSVAYGAGIGRFGRPIFFLADIERQEERDGVLVTVCGRELARGATAPPAMSREDSVIIRRDALSRWLWTRFEEWQHHPRENGFVECWMHHAGGLGPAQHEDPAAVIAAMAQGEVESLILHELGELRLDMQLGHAWPDMLAELDSRKLENTVRSLRDLWVDCSVTLPGLIERQADHSIHCWFGLLEGLRLTLSPRLMAAYRLWRENRSYAALSNVLAAGAIHWQGACGDILRVWEAEGADGLAVMLADEGLRY